MDYFVEGRDKDIKKKQGRMEAVGIGCNCDANKKRKCLIDEMSDVVEEQGHSVRRKFKSFRVKAFPVRECSPKPEGR